MTMASYFQRVESLFRAASRLEEAEREHFLRDECAGDEALLSEVRGLLQADRHPPGVLDEPAFGGDLLHTSLHAHALAHAPLPERIAAYRIIGVIGEGGMGTVYEAEQDNPRRRVALKVIRPGLASRQTAQRFRQEAQILGRLQHPGIAQILEAGAIGEGANTQPFLVMELVHGLPLLEYAENHHLDVRARVEIVAMLCDAVQHAHDHGVIHRDLKPGNILVVEDQATPADMPKPACRPKILDFGVARATNSDVQAVTLHTTAGELIGTVPYMSPEQASGDPARIDWRSDVYALGVILFELLSGRLPHDVRDRMVHEALRIIRESDATRLGSVDRTFRGDLETIADKALANDKQRRYQSAAQLGADLRRYLANEPITARPPSTIYQLRKFAHRNKALVAGVAAGLLLMLAGTALAIWQAVVATQARAVAEKESDTADLRTAEALRQAYRATIAAAAAALDAHDPTTARQRLMEISEPARQWEWRYLFAQLDQSTARFEAAGAIVGAGLAADGRYVVVVLRDGRVLEMDLATGEIARTTQLDATEILAAAVSDDGLHLGLIGDMPERFVGVADVNGTGTVRILQKIGWSTPYLAIAPDGGRVAAVQSTDLYIWDCDGGAPVCTVAAGCYSAPIKFSRDGSQVAIGCPGLLRVFDAVTGVLIHGRLVPNAGPGVELVPDTARFVTGGADKKVHVIDLAAGSESETYSGHLGHVYSVAMSADQTMIASACGDGTLRIWRRGDSLPVATFNAPALSSQWLQFLPDGSAILAHDGSAVRLWRLDAEHAGVLSGHTSFVYGVAFTPDGSRLVSGAWDRTVRVWDSQTRELLKTLNNDQGLDPYVSAVAASPDGHTVAAGYHRGGGMHSGIRLWNIDTGELVKTLPNQLGEVRALAFSRDGSLLASGRTHAPLTLWNMRDLDAPPEFLRNVGEIVSATWSPDGRLLATTHKNRAIRIWDFASRQLVREMTGLKANARSCQFSPDGRLLATAANDVRLWDVATGECRTVLDRHWDEVMCVAFSPDGKRLASGSRDTTIRIWDVEFGEEVLQLRGHGDYVYDLEFSPDGTMLASASGDSTVRLWDSVPLQKRRSWPSEIGHPASEPRP